jgi:hypothetical protein
MHPRLYRFVDFVLPKSVIKDFSRQSLADLEQYLLDRWSDQATFLAQADTDFIDGAVRYIGETLIRAGGGGWHISDEPNFAFRGRPYIQLDTADQTPISPYYLMTALLSRRTGEVLTKLFDAQLRRVNARREQESPGWQPRREPVPGISLGSDAEEAPQPERDAWVSGIPARLAALRDRSGAAAGTLDLSATSLRTLEELVLADITTMDQLEAPEHRDITDQYVAYLGETLRTQAGGEWALRPGEMGKNPYIGRPFLERTDAEGTRRTSVPSGSLGRLVRDRTAGALDRALHAYLD